MEKNKHNLGNELQRICVINYKGILVVIEPNGELVKYRAKGLRYYRREEIEWLIQKGLIDKDVLGEINDVPSNYKLYSDNTGKMVPSTLDKETQHILKEYKLTRHNSIMWKN